VAARWPSLKRDQSAIGRSAIRLSILVALLTVICSRVTASDESDLTAVLTRLDAYLRGYETQLGQLVAEERYTQCVRSGDGEAVSPCRTLMSNFGFLRLPGRPEWLGLRDTFAVDGAPVADPGRLDRVLAEESGNIPNLARRIVEENGRYNLGPVARTINVPMLALDLLGARHRSRLTFREHRDDDMDGRRVWAVRFDERVRPTLVRTPQGRDRPARGIVWVDPNDGAVLRTRLDFEPAGKNDFPAATVTVLYRRDHGVDLIVPSEMREDYRAKGAGGRSTETHAVAEYTRFRRFRADARVVQ
jgi:hypothetical protein